MPRFSAGLRATGAGSTTLPMAGLVTGANNDVYVVEIGVFNTTTTACNIAVRKITSAGTAGSTANSIPWDADTASSTATAKDVYTSTGPTLVNGYLAYASLGAAVGAGVIWTFGNKGIRCPKGTSNGLVLIPGTGTGQICDWYIVWDE